MSIDLTDTQAEELRERILDEIVEFGYTQSVTPHDWVEREIAAAGRIREKVLAFEEEISVSTSSALEERLADICEHLEGNNIDAARDLALSLLASGVRQGPES